LTLYEAVVTRFGRYRGGHHKHRHDGDNHKYSQSFSISFHGTPSSQLLIKAAALNGVLHWDNNPPSSQFDQPMGHHLLSGFNCQYPGW
jgi:hypothetical protein